MSTALIVGASRGLGRALAAEYLARGWRVIATVRGGDALADLAGSELRVEVLDTTDFAGADALKARLAGETLDLLFVNAAISGPVVKPIGEVEADQFAMLMLTNVLAPLRLADRFADLVAPAGMIAVMSSSLGSIGLNGSGGMEAYRTSKAALNMGLSSIAARRGGARTWIAADPGWVRTDMGGPGAPLAIADSIPRLAGALEDHAGQGGVHFVNYEGRILPW